MHETGLEVTTWSGSRMIPWDALIELRAMDPWPNLAVVTIEGEQTLRVGDTRAREVIASTLARGVAVTRGWYGALAVAPISVSRLPSGEARGGNYRGAASLVVARREAPTIAARLLARWSVGAEALSGAVLTADSIWFSKEGGSTWRLPRTALRSRYVRDGADVFVFGVSTELVFPRRSGCPVVEALVKQLSRGEAR